MDVTRIFRVVFKPKSILALLVVSGIIFLLLGGATMAVHEQTSNFFTKWGGILLTIGIVGWLFFVIPTIKRLWE